MTEREFYDLLLYGWFGLSALVVILLQFIDAPYGRHTRTGWGPQIPNRLAWILMELPAVLTMPIFFLLSDRRDPVSILFLVIWEVHYINRTFIYPLRTRTKAKKMPLVIALLAALTNVAVGYLLGRGLFTFEPARSLEWLSDPRFIVGLVIFLFGFALNNYADHVLLHLRKPNETGYKIPRGPAFEWVSCPNFLGEITEWIGFAILTFSLPGAAFACWTASNLIPRAQAHHRWYQTQFDDYPSRRRALVPFLL